MQLIIKLFSEISLKSQSIQRRLVMTLKGNVSTILSRFDPSVTIERQWDKLIVRSKDHSPANHARHIKALQAIPGIAAILDVKAVQFAEVGDIVRETRAIWGEQLAGKTFCVRVKRRGQHRFTSQDVQRQVGCALFDTCPNGGVNMRDPEVLIRLEIEQHTLYLVRARHIGLGGYPLGTQEQVLSLISGGFDSAVASYQFIRRGSRVHYCFFNLGGAAHLHGVQQMVAKLWQQFGSSHRVQFLHVDFAAVLADIVQHIPLGHQGVVLKRCMLRAASQLAERLDAPALVTGEALGQVASQTMSNLQVIDRASPTVVLRPLVAWDKPDIMAEARRIGVAELAERIPEYCGALSTNPSIKANLRKVEQDERHLNPDLLVQAVRAAEWQDARDIELLPLEQFLAGIGNVGAACASPLAVGLAADAVVLDVRAPDEVAAKPLRLPRNPVQCLPFYKLAQDFVTLDQAKQYLLYCERGVMSQMQAAQLRERGFANVGCYRG